jgi:hypothetical protein
LHELGQPLMLDVAKIINGKVVVQTLVWGQNLPPWWCWKENYMRKTLMICDEKDHFVLLVFFGGKSGVSESTNTIFFRKCLFQPSKH